MRSPASGMRGLDELLKDVATMSGDDFGDLCRRDGVLHVAVKVIQRGNSANKKVVHACEELFLQCMDRTRRFTHKDGKEAGALAAVGEREVESLEVALQSKRSPPPATLEAMEREKLRQAVTKPKTDKHKRPIYYGEDHVSKVPQVRSDGAGREATVCPNPRDATACPPEYDEDGVRVVMDSSATGDVRAARAAWVNKPLREKLRWTQVRCPAASPHRLGNHLRQSNALTITRRATTITECASAPMSRSRTRTRPTLLHGSSFLSTRSGKRFRCR